MRTGRPKQPLVLTEEERARLESMAHRARSQPLLARRARVVLACGDGLDNEAVARKLRCSRGMVVKWRARFLKQRLEGLYDEPRPGAPRKVSDEQVERVVIQTLESTPRGQTHWSTRELAKTTGLSRMTISRIWHAFGLQPHRIDSFKLSPDPLLIEKVRDIAGLYINPPEHALVLCVDEKSQIQALDRTQPGLPLKPGRCGTFTHDYERHGTTTLFAALQVVEGKVIGQCYPRHRHQEFLKFLRRLDEEFPGNVTLHLILDNYGTHGHERVRRWLARHPRFVLHFIPTSSSWLNLIERWFAELSQKAVRRGVFRSVEDLEQAIAAFLEAWNSNPTPFVWTASVEKILEKIARARSRLEQIQPGCSLPKRRTKCVAN